MNPWPTQLADECLSRLFAAATGDGQLDVLTREWLQRGVLIAVRADIPLDAALGLARRGQASTRARLLMVKRDLHIAQALEAVSLKPDAGTWERCKRLADLVPRFESDVWPRVRHLRSADSAWPAWRRELFYARHTGLEIPASARALLGAWKRNAGFRLPRESHTVLASYL